MQVATGVNRERNDLSRFLTSLIRIMFDVRVNRIDSGLVDALKDCVVEILKRYV